ncbi:tyrosine-protein kinase [Enterobacter cloacae subsp. cloacae]|jgi:tyrosine-protein kinase Etk/Wzc|uniref:tyrosine-protein kinase n=1 Tax=Enterobacter cloacae TaxID=550 RepID=UPI0006830A4F|nr:tyrosine-protein kinase [Enterobacter cloacae]MBF4109764.1 tyrosine-protein kinase [Enterobacter cloacae]MBG0521760.1 tyrosine-protein kinase [Enterobacter cloacae]MBW4201555.1 tyrosine-protein kinase [Enterobacter cloacae subsp. cloacae]MCU6202319.1 tyrosine-protein kinase [Enterobacter cloacae]MDT8892017.1 tyrosine-protein kinase [Enterobacter cloacae]
MSSYTSESYGAAAPENHEIDLIRLLGEMIDHRAVILSITFIFTLLAGLYAFLATPVYRADALIQVEGKQDNSLLKNLKQFGSEMSPDVQPEILLLKSRMILGATVDELGLAQHVTQRTFPVVGGLWARLQGRKPATIDFGWLQLPPVKDKPRTLVLTVLEKGAYRLEGDNFYAEGMEGKPFEKEGVSLLVSKLNAPTGTQFTLQTRPRLEAINLLSTQFSVVESAKQSGVLTLTLTGTDPDRIALVLNRIANNYLQQNIARQEAQDARSLAFLQQQLPKIRSELDLAEERLNQYRKQRDSVDLSLEAKSVLEQIVNIENQLNELTFREAEISQLFKKDHPNYRALREKRQTLEQERIRLNQRVAAMPSTQQDILRLSRDVESGRTIYLQLLTRQQELNISRSSAIGNVRIIDSAVTQPDPIKPRKALVIVFGILLGLILSVGLVLVRMALRRGINTADQLEGLGVQVMATLPRSAWLWKKTNLRRKRAFGTRWKHRITDVPFLPVDRPADIFVEAVRGLRTSLHFTLQDAANRIVMISGPTQDCGKTLVSTSLAAIEAQAGLRVLFIDADMREGYVHNVFGLTNHTGLSGVLDGKCECQEAIQRYEKGNIDVLTCGPVPLRPSELLMSERFRAVMTWANEQYDLVILDTPPVLAVTDASVAAPVAATSLLVARFAKTSLKEMENSIKRLQQTGAYINGTVLNDVVKSAALYYRAGYGHYEYGQSPTRQPRKD